MNYRLAPETAGDADITEGSALCVMDYALGVCDTAFVPAQLPSVYFEGRE